MTRSTAKLHPEYWEKRKDGRLIDSGSQVGLSWGHPEVRAYKVRAVARLVETSGVDGVLLDYCRYFGKTALVHLKGLTKLNPEPFLLKKVEDEDDKDEHRQDQDQEPNHGK